MLAHVKRKLFCRLSRQDSVPLPPQLGSTSVVLSGVELPLLYVSKPQVNVAIPFDVQVNTARQLVVLRGNAVSVPVSRRARTAWIARQESRWTGNA